MLLVAQPDAGIAGIDGSVPDGWRNRTVVDDNETITTTPASKIAFLAT